MDWAVELSQDNAHERKIWVTILGHPDFFLMHVVSSTNHQMLPVGMCRAVWYGTGTVHASTA